MMMMMESCIGVRPIGCPFARILGCLVAVGVTVPAAAQCGKGAGDCCAPGSGPGCEEFICCQTVCVIDPFCCETEWDDLCATLASFECKVCGGSGGSNCCLANGGTGCDDAACQDAVCATDPLCCDTKWDATCASEALKICAVCFGGNNCCFGHVGAGCEDPACEEAVCAIDPLCCEVAWDSICASEAADFCGDLCGGGESNCCIPNGGLGCDDPVCQAAVCAVDPFCCDVAWDGICAGEAAELCAVCGGSGGPPNDECTNKIGVGTGLTSFSNVGATSDGPADLCPMDSDVWFRHVATCQGAITFSVCNSDFDTTIAIYTYFSIGGAVCQCHFDPPFTLLACNDDACGEQSQVTIHADEGACYLVRIGGANGAQGSGTLAISHGGPLNVSCPADIASSGGDGEVGPADLAELLANWGVCQSCTCPGDIDPPGGDVFVGADDLAELLAQWGPCPK